MTASTPATIQTQRRGVAGKRRKTIGRRWSQPKSTSIQLIVEKGNTTGSNNTQGTMVLQPNINYIKLHPSVKSFTYPLIIRTATDTGTLKITHKTTLMRNKSHIMQAARSMSKNTAIKIYKYIYIQKIKR